jgi:hypothetical protein
MPSNCGVIWPLPRRQAQTKFNDARYAIEVDSISSSCLEGGSWGGVKA